MAEGTGVGEAEGTLVDATPESWTEGRQGPPRPPLVSVEAGAVEPPLVRAGAHGPLQGLSWAWIARGDAV